MIIGGAILLLYRSRAGQDSALTSKGPSTLMTAFPNPLFDAMWQPIARSARAGGTAFGERDSRSASEGVVQRLYRIAEQSKSIERFGTGKVGRRRKQ